MFQESFREVSNMFQGGFKRISRKFQECFRGVLRKFHLTNKGTFVGNYDSNGGRKTLTLAGRGGGGITKSHIY